MDHFTFVYIKFPKKCPCTEVDLSCTELDVPRLTLNVPKLYEATGVAKEHSINKISVVVVVGKFKIMRSGPKAVTDVIKQRM